MSREQRSDINNGIWLCSNCADLIDRDEIRFTVELLKQIKKEHENSRRIENHEVSDEGDIIAIGASIVTVGEVLKTGPTGIRARIVHFVEGSGSEILSFAESYERIPEKERYVLLNQLGYGSTLSQAPTVDRQRGDYFIEFSLNPQLPRISPSSDVKTLCAESMRILYGMDALVQNFENTLSLARGTWFAEIEGGSDLSDLYWRYRDSPWFARLAMKEMIRLSCLPSHSKNPGSAATPLACVKRVKRVEVPTFELNSQRLPVNVEFEIEGLGLWKGTLEVYIYTPDLLQKSRQEAEARATEIGKLKNSNKHV